MPNLRIFSSCAGVRSSKKYANLTCFACRMTIAFSPSKTFRRTLHFIPFSFALTLTNFLNILLFLKLLLIFFMIKSLRTPWKKYTYIEWKILSISWLSQQKFEEDRSSPSWLHCLALDPPLIKLPYSFFFNQ